MVSERSKICIFSIFNVFLGKKWIIIILTKSDLLKSEECDELLSQVKGHFKSTKVIVLSNKTSKGLIDVISLFESGITCCVIGMSGVGKTTLIKLMVGLLHPTSGSIEINNYIPWKRNHDFLKMITVVMGQKNQLWWDIPATESFLLNKRIYQIDDKSYNQMLNEMIELLDVKDKIHTQVRRLSLGERMKMEIIASLLHHKD